MKMPGFTAEVSLDKAHKQYKKNRMATYAGKDVAVLPQIWYPCELECMVEGGSPAECRRQCRRFPPILM
jgi:hypothetical protein